MRDEVGRENLPGGMNADGKGGGQMVLDYAQRLRASRRLLFISGALFVVVCLAWWLARTSPWGYEARRDPDEFHFRIWTDAYEIHFGEQHHFEEWHVAYWKLCMLSL